MALVAEKKTNSSLSLTAVKMSEPYGNHNHHQSNMIDANPNCNNNNNNAIGNKKIRVKSFSSSKLTLLSNKLNTSRNNNNNNNNNINNNNNVNNNNGNKKSEIFVNNIDNIPYTKAYVNYPIDRKEYPRDYTSSDEINNINNSILSNGYVRNSLAGITSSNPQNKKSKENKFLKKSKSSNFSTSNTSSSSSANYFNNTNGLRTYTLDSGQVQCFALDDPMAIMMAKKKDKNKLFNFLLNKRGKSSSSNANNISNMSPGSFDLNNNNYINSYYASMANNGAKPSHKSKQNGFVSRSSFCVPLRSFAYHSNDMSALSAQKQQQQQQHQQQTQSGPLNNSNTHQLTSSNSQVQLYTNNTASNLLASSISTNSLNNSSQYTAGGDSVQNSANTNTNTNPNLNGSANNNVNVNRANVSSASNASSSVNVVGNMNSSSLAHSANVSSASSANIVVLNTTSVNASAASNNSSNSNTSGAIATSVNASASSANPSTNSSAAVAAAAGAQSNNPNSNGNMYGYLFKWTNYLKGYQKRWIFLNNGFLSYYRSQNEMDHTCRGAINLANAHIHQNEDGVSFVVSNGGNQTFHLRASNDVERQKWINALELAKNKARPYGHQPNSSFFNGISNNQHDSDDDEASNESEKNELENLLHVLQHKLNELTLSHEFVLKQSNMLSKSLTELENIQSKPDETAIKTINERSTIYKVAMNGVLNNCQEFINLAQFQTRKMHKILQSEHEIRLRLEDMVQEMAKQHLNIETQLNKRGKRILGRANHKRDKKSRTKSYSNSLAKMGINNNGNNLSNSNLATTALTSSSSSNNNNNNRSNSINNLNNNSNSSTNVNSGHNNNNNNNNNNVINSSTTSSKLSCDGVLLNSETNSQANASDLVDKAGKLSNVDQENTGQSNNNDGEDQYLNDDEFHDAVEDVTQFSVTLPRAKGLHQRNPSNISKLYLQESDDSEDDESQTIKVTMHTNKDTSGDSHNNKLSEPATTSSASLASSAADGQNAVAVKKKPSSLDLKSVVRTARQRRMQIVPRPNYSLNLWSIMKNCIGKDLSKIPIPVNFSEPLSMLQRITEELEYSHLLDLAAQCEDQWEQMAYVAAFTVSSYSTTATRTNKPFNPLLGETFECDRLDDYGWRSIAEQVSHHPPAFATHVESAKDWKFYQEFTMSSKFRGQYLQVIPLGTSHLEFKKTGHHYTWRKVTTFVRNIIVGKLWIDNVGEMDIINHTTKDVCHLKYFAYSYFSREPPRKVTGIITDANNVARYVLNGTWTEQIEGAPVLNPQVVTQQTQLNTGKSKILWKRKYPPPILESMYNFTELAIQLNEPEEGVAPTDSRLRPDQRLMEEAKWDDANREKLRLEEKQRTARKQREQAMTNNGSNMSYSNSVDFSSNNNNNNGYTNQDDDDTNMDNLMRRQSLMNNQSPHDPEPAWFKKIIDPFTNVPIHVFKNDYWECKENQDWKRCPDIF